MPKLFAFGCSHTYGQGLPDCIEGKKAPGPNPSKLGWVSKIGEALKKDVVNKGVCGAGNKEILWNLIKHSTLITPEDSVIIQWSYFERNCIIRRKRPGITANFDGVEVIKFGPWDTNKINKIYYKFLQDETDDVYSAALYVNHANFLLNHYGIKKVLMIEPADNKSTTTMMRKEFNELILPGAAMSDKNVTHFRFDTALDDTHVGVKGNAEFARKALEHYGHILK